MKDGPLTGGALNPNPALLPLEHALRDRKAEALTGCRLRIEPVEFDWKADAPRSGRDVGVIAEDIETLFPLVVVRDRAGVPAVNYPKLCVYLIRAVQELAARN